MCDYKFRIPETGDRKIKTRIASSMFRPNTLRRTRLTQRVGWKSIRFPLSGIRNLSFVCLTSSLSMEEKANSRLRVVNCSASGCTIFPS